MRADRVKWAEFRRAKGGKPAFRCRCEGERRQMPPGGQHLARMVSAALRETPVFQSSLSAFGIGS